MIRTNEHGALNITHDTNPHSRHREQIHDHELVAKITHAEGRGFPAFTRFVKTIYFARYNDTSIKRPGGSQWA
ncbi:hypothetical protein [Tardiphaga sp. 813_E8_N1_3]|uniref:hypothetical protein n=1 Tax=Tardiphaga sp. 813_E8_N1_3 TaxID=3240760 RepID=UPI003F28D5F6